MLIYCFFFLSSISPVNARVRALLQGIEDVSDETTQMVSLTELCEMLSMGTEETLQGVYCSAKRALTPVLLQV